MSPWHTFRRSRRLFPRSLSADIALDGGERRLRVPGRWRRRFGGLAPLAGVAVGHGVDHFHRKVLGPDLAVSGSVAGDPEDRAPGDEAPEGAAAERQRRPDALVRDVQV